MASVVVISVVLPATAISPASANQYSTKISQLQAQQTQLQQQLTSVQNQKGSDAGSAVSTQNSIEALQAQMASAQISLDNANARLASTTANVVTTQQTVASDKAQLSYVFQELYLQGQQRPVAQAFTSSGGLQGAVDATITLGVLQSEVSQLTTTVISQENSLKKLQSQEQSEQSQATTLVNQLQSTNAQLTAQESALTADVASLTGQGKAIAGQISSVAAGITQEKQAEAAAIAAAARARVLAAERAAALAEEAAGSGGAIAGAAPGTVADNHFPWGQCTWYVATQVYVPWFGNADQWVSGAEADGYPVGMQPRVGAIVVWGPGSLYDPYYGHVAYVIAVQGPNDFTVAEANYDFPGTGEPDDRQVNTLGDVEGFIYQSS